MKKLIVLVLITAVAALSFADDALVLPKGVLRIYETTSYAFTNNMYDENGEVFEDETAVDNPYYALNIGAALEYGITDWISAAFQWGPGWNVWSSIKDYDDQRLNGLFDIFAGAKIQIIGAKAPVANEKMRLAFAPGVKIPLPGPDWDSQVDNAVAGDPYTIAAVDKHTWGFGARAYFDYVFTPALYLNLYGEFIYYPIGTPLKETNLSAYFPVQMPGDLNYGYDLTLEMEPHYELMVGDGMRLGLGLPVAFSMTPELELEGTALPDTNTTLLTVSPSVSLFLMKTMVPLEFELSYRLPLMGKSIDATNAITLQIKSYLKF